MRDDKYTHVTYGLGDPDIDPRIKALYTKRLEAAMQETLAKAPEILGNLPPEDGGRFGKSVVQMLRAANGLPTPTKMTRALWAAFDTTFAKLDTKP